jgi:hypothetical protein
MRNARTQGRELRLKRLQQTHGNSGYRQLGYQDPFVRLAD